MLGAMPAQFTKIAKKLAYFSLVVDFSYLNHIMTIGTTKKQQLPRPRFEPATFGT